MTGIDQAKRAIRERVWSQLEASGRVEPGVRGYIPAFEGASDAADRLATLPAWKRARVLEVVPDRAQFPVRQRALEAGKLLYMAVPKLAEAEPFYLLDPQCLTVEPIQAADREVASRVGQLVAVTGMQPIDLLVCGSVAVNAHGARLGKGAGYSDIEFALLAEAGLVGEQTIVATTVDELQVVDEDLPERDHDFRVDLVITPRRVIRCDAAKRPTGLDWGLLRADQLAAIPALKRLKKRPGC